MTMGMVLVTGGAGFIGSNFIQSWITETGQAVVNLDKLTYAGNLANLQALRNDSRHNFVKGDIADRELVEKLLSRYQPDAIVHFAAESHVDRSILGPEDFITTNVIGTFRMLEATRAYWESLAMDKKGKFRFLHVSTDEVYGSLDAADRPFMESSPYAPNSPYAASKAASDHLVRTYYHTYGVPTITTNCSNNYGPYQFPEKLIPLVIVNAINGRSLPIYGDGLNVRDWLFVADHCSAIRTVLARGRVGETYNIGGNSEKNNLEVVRTVCAVLDELNPDSPAIPHATLIKFVKDRSGHDRRYAIDASKIKRDLGWEPQKNFTKGIRETVRWYLDHLDWVEQVLSGEYRKWIDINYGGRQLI
jgi:dTDP-glucose 4,6-dehydratase